MTTKSILVPSPQEAREIERLLRNYDRRHLQTLCTIFEHIDQRTQEDELRQAQLQAASEAKEAEEQRQREALVIAEYEALHSEIEKRIELRQQLLLSLFVVAGTFLTLGVGDVVGTGEVTLLYPVIAFFIGGTWAHNDRRIGEICRYIRTEIEEKYHFIGWETHRKRLYEERQQAATSVGKKMIHTIASKLAQALESLDFSTRGAFLTPQLLALVIGIVRCIPSLTSVWGWAIALPLVLAAGGAIWRTWYLIEHQRDRGAAPGPAPITQGLDNASDQITTCEAVELQAA